MAKLLFDVSHLPGSYAHRLAHSHWSLDLSRDHRFSASWGACLGGSALEGTWRLEGDLLILESDPPREPDDLHQIETRYIPVWWGNRHLLITESQLPAFCADARGQAPPQESQVNGLYFVKVLASGAPAGVGAPVVPERFRHFYKSGPIRAQVGHLNDDGTVTLDKGSADRLQVGMWLTIGWFRDDIEVEVVSVSEHSAIARPFYSPRSERRIAVGEKLTTGERGQYPDHSSLERFTEPPPPRPRIAIRHKDTGEILARLYAPPEGHELYIDGDLQGADLREAAPSSDAPLNLVGARGWFAHLQGATMEGQTLSKAGFRCGQLEGANARSANLEEADLSDAGRAKAQTSETTSASEPTSARSRSATRVTASRFAASLPRLWVSWRLPSIASPSTIRAASRPPSTDSSAMSTMIGSTASAVLTMESGSRFWLALPAAGSSRRIGCGWSLSILCRGSARPWGGGGWGPLAAPSAARSTKF